MTTSTLPSVFGASTSSCAAGYLCTVILFTIATCVLAWVVVGLTRSRAAFSFYFLSSMGMMWSISSLDLLVVISAPTFSILVSGCIHPTDTIRIGQEIQCLPYVGIYFRETLNCHISSTFRAFDRILKLRDRPKFQLSSGFECPYILLLYLAWLSICLHQPLWNKRSYLLDRYSTIKSLNK